MDAPPPDSSGKRHVAPLPHATTRLKDARHMLSGDTPISRRAVVVGGAGLIAASSAAVLLGHDALGQAFSYLLGQNSGAGDQGNGAITTPYDIVIFNGKLAPSWQDHSWASRRLPDTSTLYHHAPTVTMHVSAWGALAFVHDPLDITSMGYVQCWVRGVNSSGQRLAVSLVDENKTWHGGVSLGKYTQSGSIASGTWQLARIPMAAFGLITNLITMVVLQANGSGDQGNVQLADLRLVYAPDLRPPLLTQLWAYDLRTITLAFSLPMKVSSVQDATAYQITSTTDNAFPSAMPVTPSAVRYHGAARTVSLLLPTAMQAGQSYSVAVRQIVDVFGVPTALGLESAVKVSATPLTINCDVAANRHAISPDIYGVANLDASIMRDVGARVGRWGGNPTSRYNWKLGNAWNAGRDYYFKNGNYGHTSPADRQPSGVADQQIAANRALNTATLLTIPALGWVARNDDLATQSSHVPSDGGPPLTPDGDAINGYDPTANRQHTSVPSRARKGSSLTDPPNLSDPTVAQDEWVYHLTRRFGSAAQGGVKYYAIDNEPDLWSSTHTDMRPAELGYEQMRNLFLDYARAIKAADPTAQIVAPVTWHWRTLLYSPLDRGNDNYQSHPDYDAHGRVPFLSWWLEQIRQHDEARGARTLDVFDWHMYPQGGEYSDDVSPKMAALRLRSTRILWDPHYVAESWIGEVMQVIPRMRKMVAEHYPGTRISLSEWSWGAEGSMNGALALADVLGIFGREGLDMACLWGSLAAGAPSHFAFKLFGNYDDNGGSFLGTSFLAQSSDDTLLRCYATQAPGNGALLLMVLNVSPDSDLTPELRIANASGYLGGAQVRRARVWQYTLDHLAGIVPGADVPVTSGGDTALHIIYTFPAYSITLLRLEAGA